MPDITPVYGITFPCVGEAINAATFTSFATTMEAALATVAAVGLQALHPPSVGARVNQAVTVATPTDCTCVEKYWDNASIAAVASTAFTAPVTGMYQLAASVGAVGFTTMTSLKLALTVNTVEQLVFKYPASTGASPVSVNPHGLLRLVAADQVRARLTWTGTGGPITANGAVSITLHSRLS